MDRPEKTFARIANELAIGNDIALARLHVDSHRLDRAIATTTWVDRWLTLQNAVDRSRYPNCYSPKTAVDRNHYPSSYCPKCTNLLLEVQASGLEAGVIDDMHLLVCSNRECTYEREI